MKAIIYISSIPWNYSWHRQQEMMSKMAEAGYLVLFVQPVQNGRIHVLGPEMVKENIWLLTPNGLPYERCLSTANGFNSLLATKAISSAMNEMRIENPIIWLDRVHGFDFSAFSKYRTVYDLVDEILAFGRFRNGKMLLRLENRVLRNADLLLSSSNTLLKRKIEQSGRTGECCFLPNGVDTTRFTGSNKKNRSHIIVGFIGTVGRRRINFSLVHTIAAAHPEWQFVFVGPGTNKDKEKLKGEFENIEVRDAVEGKQIPGTIEQFDVGIIPYNHCKADMDYVFPRKACEYLAAGIPVVSTSLPEVEVLKPYVHTADTAEEFSAAIEYLVGSNDREANKRFAAQYDWNFLMSELIKKLQLEIH